MILESEWHTHITCECRGVGRPTHHNTLTSLGKWKSCQISSVRFFARLWCLDVKHKTQTKDLEDGDRCMKTAKHTLDFCYFSCQITHFFNLFLMTKAKKNKQAKNKTNKKKPALILVRQSRSKSIKFNKYAKFTSLLTYPLRFVFTYWTPTVH